jgi:1-aminocyclopropane-1-carboxylate deaminase/D-cysteine desulfhydrase-like pyridoxal-dependent ACC family enzyme
MTNTESELQPCERCGKVSPPAEDEKYDDVYLPVREGSVAMRFGYAQERLCGRCACAQFIGSYWNGTPDRTRTPIEQYLVFDRAVYVKRDDLWNKGKYGGGNAKLRGAEVRLRGLKESGITHVAVMDAKTSRAGWGIAELCRDLGMKCTDFYGRYKGELTTTPYDRNQFEAVREEDMWQLPLFQARAHAAGAQIIAMPASRVYPMYYKARKYCQENNIYLMPMGLQLTEAILSTAGEASALSDRLRCGTIVCCVATGTMFAGLLLGLRDTARIIGVYIGMTSGEIKGRVGSDPEAIVRRRIKSLLPDGFEPPPFEIALADREYYAEDNYPCPFPCDKWYDRKAWRWMVEHLPYLDNLVLLWNIG